MTIRTHLFDAGGHFGRRLPLIRRTLQAAIDHVGQVSPLDNVDIAVHPLDFGPDQFAVSAFAMGPHNVHLGIERSQLSSEELEPELFRTTVHELHHAWRWRHIRARWSVAEAVVLEGLAVLADQDAAGPQDGVDRPLHDPKRALAHFQLIRADPVSRHRAWLYSSEETQPGGLGRVYTLGRLLMQASLAGLGETPWEAATRPAIDLLDLGQAALSQNRRSA